MMSALVKRMILVIIICVVIITIVGAVLAIMGKTAFLPVLFGALFGAAISIVKILMIERTVNKAADMDTESVGNYIRVQHLFRFVITGALFVVAVFVPFVNTYSAAAGILSFQAATLSMRQV